MKTEKSISLAYEQLRSCRLCARGCGVDRMAGERGFCGQTAQIKAARAALHFWEEPCISGSRGSGAVFFSGCSLQCVFCQNKAISRGDAGKSISAERLSDIYLQLQAQGAHNINLVTPTHFIPQIIESAATARGLYNRGATADMKERAVLTVPIVYNTSSYESSEALALLDGTADIYLADAKFYSPKLSERYCGAADYFRVCLNSLRQMAAQTGAARFDADGMMQKGVIIRILLMPGHLDDAEKLAEVLYSEFGNSVYFSLMSQYTPVDLPGEYAEIDRKVSAEEYDAFIDFAVDLGITNGFMQEGDAAEESFIPNFDGEGL